MSNADGVLFQIEDREENAFRRWLPVAGCLCAAVSVAVLVCPARFLKRATPLEAIVWSCFYVAVVFAVTACTAWATRRVRRTIDVAAWACWLAPIMIFLVRGASWTVPASGVLAALIAALLYRTQGTASEDTRENRFTVALVAAILIQTGLLAGIAGQLYAAALLIATVCFVVAWNTLRAATPAGPVPVFHSGKLRNAGKVALAVATAIIALAPYSGAASGQETGETTSANRHAPQEDNLYSGIVLVPPFRSNAIMSSAAAIAGP